MCTTERPAPVISIRAGSSRSLCNRDQHLLTVCRSAERTALRANLVVVRGLEVGSLGVPRTKDDADRPGLTPWPIDRPRDWTDRVNRPFGPKEEEAVRRSIQRGQPYGWFAVLPGRGCQPTGVAVGVPPRGPSAKEASERILTPFSPSTIRKGTSR